MCTWNGGRINRDITPKPYQIEFYKNHNIPINLTFSNPIIDVTDDVGNELLEMFYFGENGIILINDELREYIVEKYPNYKLTYSITGTGGLDIPMTDSCVAFYKDLETKYDLIVPRMEHILDERFNELDQSKYEVMVNDTCSYSCKHYKDHFEAIANFNTKGLSIDSDGAVDVEECWLSDFDTSEDSTHCCMDLTDDVIARLYARGIRHFKITGRELNSIDFESALRYIR